MTETKKITHYKNQADTLEYMCEWLMGTEFIHLFQRGKLTVGVSSDFADLRYILPSTHAEMKIKMPLSFPTRRSFDEGVEMLKDFIMNCFYFYEWDGEPLSMAKIATLTGVSRVALTNTMKQAITRIHIDPSCKNLLKRLHSKYNA